MGPVTEVIPFSLKSDDSSQPLSQLLTDTVLQQPGCLRVRYGRLHEDTTKFHCFIDWDDDSRYEQFKATPAYTQFLEKIGPLVESPPEPHCVKFDPTPSPVLDNKKTPVVEVLYLHYPTDDSFTLEMKDKATDSAKQALAEFAPMAKGFTAETALGWTESINFKGEPCRALALLIGWESVEAHNKFRGTESFEKGTSLLRETAGLKGVFVAHVSLTTVEQSN